MPRIKHEKLTRSNVIGQLRDTLLRMTDDDHSMCQIAAEKGIFCGGFKQHTEAELKERYDWLARKNPEASRDEIEDLANRWQLARQEYSGLEFACDVQLLEHHTCRGWDEFTNEDLAKFYRELLGKEIVVTA